MPYVDKEIRQDSQYTIKFTDTPSAGELNYQLTMLVRAFLKSKGECYQTYNDIIGALEGAKLELYRRVAANYEDKKIIENGDIY